MTKPDLWKTFQPRHYTSSFHFGMVYFLHVRCSEKRNSGTTMNETELDGVWRGHS